MKKLIGIFAMALMALFAPAPAHADPPKLKVVTTTVLFEDLANKIGGERVEVKHVASPKFNVHFIQPKPSDVRNVSKADLFIFTGLDLEAWADPLLEAAGKRALFRGGERNVDLSRGIPLLKVPARLDRAEGDLHAYGNPHYTLNPEHLRPMAETLAADFKSADPTGAAEYDANLAKFLSELDSKLAEWRVMAAGLRGKEIVSYHDDIAYLADFAGLKADVFIEPKAGIPPTPKHLQYLEEYLPANGIKVITSPTFYSRATLEGLAKRTGAKAVTVLQNAGELPGTDDVFAFHEHNLRVLSEELK
jgi:ABC-type Zn uptake system ZnuABC Zn-binding protein ZnuA